MLPHALCSCGSNDIVKLRSMLQALRQGDSALSSFNYFSFPPSFIYSSFIYACTYTGPKCFLGTVLVTEGATN